MHGIRLAGIFLVLMLTLALLPVVAMADDYIGGIPLTTVQTGTVTGDLWFDVSPAPNWGDHDVTKTFTLPAAAVEQPGRIQWARLYISAYCGHMENNYTFWINNSWDGNGDGIYEQTWQEHQRAPFIFLYNGGNDNSAFPGHGDGEPYKIINDHENRVTSDYLMYYNVTDMIHGQTVNVNVNTTGTFDGRIKVISLVVAYDDPASTTQTTYWVNQGHDSCSYYNEDYLGYAAVGSTTFATTGLTNITSATLTIDYLASNNGYYGFPTADNNFEYTGGTPPVEGTFTDALDREPDVQGPYSGVDSWNVTSSVTGSSDVTFAYARYFPATGISQFYKIPLAILEVKRQPAATPPVANFSANVTSGNSPLTVQFTDLSTDATGWAWDFDNDGTVDSTVQNPVYTFTTAGYYTVNLTVTGPGGSDSEVKTDYITARCDLQIQGVLNPIASTVFCYEPNTYRISLVKNNVGNSPATEILVTTSDGWSGQAPVPPMTQGQQIQFVDIVDPTIRTIAGGSVTFTVTIDPDNVIPETNEANNQKTSNKQVKFNGYKSTDYWTGKERVRTYLTYDLRGDIIHSFGDGRYRSGSFGGGWYTDTVNWTAADLVVPEGATVVTARLYIPYCWDAENEIGSGTTTTTFNGVTVTPAHYENDSSNFGAYPNYMYGLLTYDVTSLYNVNENNTATLTRTLFNGLLSPAGFTLAVVYEDQNESRKQIFVNEGWDILGADESGYATNETEATAYQEYTGMTIDMASVDNVTLTTFVPWGAAQSPERTGEGNLFVNGGQIASDVWNYGEEVTGESDSPQVAVDTRNVKQYLNANGTGNVIGIQSTSGGSPLMVAERTFLVAEYLDEAPVADFSATPTSGDAPLQVTFTDLSTGASEWAWDFNNDGVIDSTVRDPVYTYNTTGTYTVNLTVTGPGGSDSEVKADYVTVSQPSMPDLVVTAISPNKGAGEFLFGNESNIVNVMVANQGSAAAGAFTVSLDAAGAVYNASVDGLAASASTNVTLNDTTLRSAGAAVTLTATADSANMITESDETNNVATSTPAVYNNGYKGKRYTGGSDISTQLTFEGRYGLDYSTGNSAYAGAGWTTKTVTWTSDDLQVPAGATVVAARLYQGYTFDQTPGGNPSWTMTFNDNTVTPIATYNDTKGYGTYNYPSGLFVYDVTSLFNATGNSMTITNGTGNNNGIYGAYLVVVYEDPQATVKAIYINDECDMLYSGTARSVSNDEGTAYAGFAGVNSSDVKSAKAIAILPSANEAGKSKFLFNGADLGGFESGYQAGTQVTFKEFDVAGQLVDGSNIAGLQSYVVSGSGDNMVATNAILIVEYNEPAPIADFSASPTTGTAPLQVNFTDLSTGATSWAWDFNNDGNVDSTDQNPVYEYTLAGTYTVNLTVTGPGGTDSEVKTDYITVTAPEAPVAAFTAAPRAGLAPLTVQFTDQSTNANAWAWDFNNDGNVDSTIQSPAYEYPAAGTYTVNLTVTGPGGSNTLVKANYIAVSSGTLPLTTKQSGTVSGGLYVGAYQPVPWSSQPTAPGLKEFTQTYTIPTFTNVQWARLYAVVYAAGTDDRAGIATTSFDGNGDGTYETSLGTETLNIPASGNGNVYWQNDHVNRVYSDYLIWYDVTSLVSSQDVNAKIVTENAGGSNFDGRLKTLTLVVAYNDGDSDQVKYWVNDGHDYQGSSDPASQTVFGTSVLEPGWVSAELSNVHLSSKDASYTFNGHEYTGANPVAPYGSFVYNTWNVTANATAGSDNTLEYEHAAGSSYKTPFAFLAVKYTAPPVDEVNATVTGYTIPATMNAGESYPVSITVQNTGSLPWNESSLFRLGMVGDDTGDAYKFNGITARVWLPDGANVLPGESVTFNYVMTAPLVIGEYHPSYRMVWEGHQWYGEQLDTTINVTAPLINATIVGNSIPDTITAGTPYTVTITVQNTGSLPWNETSLFRLGMVDDDTGDAYKLNGTVMARVWLPDGVEVLPGESYTFTFALNARIAPGTYHPSYRMVWEGHKWFGDTLTKTVNVVGPDAIITGDTIPTTMVAGQTYDASITVQNTGSLPWNESNLFRLGMVDDESGDAYKFDGTTARVWLPAGANVLPGETVTFTYTMTAPTTTGTYHPAYRMVWEAHEWYGATLTRDITVG